MIGQSVDRGFDRESAEDGNAAGTEQLDLVGNTHSALSPFRDSAIPPSGFRETIFALPLLRAFAIIFQT